MRHAPAQLKPIPAAYFSPSDQPGTLERFTYSTYESFSYTSSHPQRITKQAIVYLPYGYTSEKRYPVMYISHGGWSDETTTMGTPQNPHAFKYIVDHAIASGEMTPMILVNLTYNNASPKDSSDYALALELTDRYWRELTKDLIPAIESHYSTFVTSSDPEDLKASRNWRGFSGFSMGSVNTWHAFEHAFDYLSVYNPMSGGAGLRAEELAEHIRKKERQNFSIYAYSGTADFAYAGFRAQIAELTGRAPDTFRAEQNVFFRERAGAQHDYAAVCEYTYNTLAALWKEMT